MIEMRGVGKRFGDVVALDGVDLLAAPGRILAVLGPNGAGKTTAIEVLATLLVPDAGTATVAGHDVVADAGAVRATIGLTGQYAALDDQLTARENLVLFGRLLGLGRAGSRARAAQLLERFDLVDAADRRVGGFSGGMRRRVDLAASLVGHPSVLFLDEPTTGLDPRSREVLWAVVRELRAASLTILLTTQYLAEADELADDVVVLDRGAVIERGTPSALKQRVGRSVCRVLAADPATREAARAALAPRWAVTARDDELTVPAEGPRTLVEVVRELDAAGVEPDDVGLRRPSLDDVFFALTGRDAGPDAGPVP